ncbi:hypothetical protein A2U01_0099873, partial [Trifolium medium]|nr:hypothetical protein [Trifolium medium]
ARGAHRLARGASNRTGMAAAAIGAPGAQRLARGAPGRLKT